MLTCIVEHRLGSADVALIFAAREVRTRKQGSDPPVAYKSRLPPQHRTGKFDLLLDVGSESCEDDAKSILVVLNQPDYRNDESANSSGEYGGTLVRVLDRAESLFLGSIVGPPGFNVRP